MSILQDNLNTIKETASELADVINQIAKMNGSDVEIGECTSFADYPELLRKATSATSGIVTVFAYRISDIDPGVPDTDGSFDFVSNTYSAPENWNKSDDIKMTDSDTVWMSQATFASNSDTDSKIVGSWSRPVKISSPHPKSISEFIQTVYFRSSSEMPPQKPIGNGDMILTEESQADGWSKINLGISKTYPYIWSSMRTREDSGWSTYSTPILYAYYPQDGKDGESAKLTRTAFAFTSTASRSDKPNTPKGGYWNISTNALTLPEGWSESPNTTDEKKYSWLSTAVFSSDKPGSPEWTEPSCVTGEDGVDGTDGATSEFIYALLPATEDYATLVSTMNTKGYSLEISDTDVVPNFILNGELIGTSIKVNRLDNTSFTVRLTDSPIGIDDTYNKIEIYWTRTKTSSGSWGNWVGPMYWSMWGENGMDGDGIEYIFTASNDETCDILPPVYADLVINDPAEAERFQQREYVPEGWFDDDDDWKGLDAEVPFLFCSSRKQYTTEDGKKMWGEFSTPKIWGHYGKDGNGAYTSFAFCISKEDLSKYTVTGGYYGDSLKNLVTEDESGNEVDIKWHDTLNSTPKFDETIWMINKFFNGSENESLKEWAGPTKMADSEHFQVEFNCPIEGDSKSYYNGEGLISLQAFKEMTGVEYTSHDELESEWRKYVYNNGGGLWNDGGSGAVYMATARCINNIWEDWSINKIQGEAGDTTQFIFILTNGELPANPTPADLSGEYQKDDFKPEGWSFEPKTVSETSPVCWVSQRLRKSGKWEAYSDPAAWSMYAKGNVHLEIEQDVIGIPIESDGTVDKDYKDFIINKLFLYDNGKLVTNGVWTALVNDDNDDFTIDSVLTSIPTDTSTCGFYGTTLYLGREFLNRYVNDDKLIVECRVEYNGVPYAKSFTINKSTNIYELEIPKNVLVLDSNGAFKDSVLEVTPVKWVEDKFSPVRKGYIEYILTPESGNPMKAGYNVNDETAEINLLGYTNIQSIQINYKETSTSDVLTYEHIGTVRDGKDALNKFKSTIFCRTNADIGSEKYRPKGGSYEDPFPTSGYTVPDKLSNGSISTSTNNTWSDGIPPYDEADPKQIWSSTKWFISDNSQEDEWSIPVLMQDTNDIDIWWSDSDVPTPGNPDDPLLGAIWYDGDDAYGNNITHSPIWMAMRRQVNGTWSQWVVSKVKGEKGDKGDKGDKGEPGEPGVNGGFGPMARYGIWASGNEYYSRDDDGMWYDIVEYRGSYYLCKAKHLSSDSLTPDSATAYWTKAAQFEFVAIDTAAIANLIAQNIEVTKLRTNGGNAQIQIEAGEMKVYASQSDAYPDISFGVDDDGFALIKFYDKAGNLVYSIGPNGGYKEYTKSTVKDWINHSGLSRLDSTFDYLNLKDAIPDVIEQRLKYKDSLSMSVTLYERVDKVDNAPQPYNGKYFSTTNAYDSNLVNGLYCNTSTYIGTALSEFKEEDTVAKIEEFNEKYPSCAVSLSSTNNYYIHQADLTYFVNGDIVYEETIYFQTNWSNPRQ